MDRNQNNLNSTSNEFIIKEEFSSYKKELSSYRIVKTEQNSIEPSPKNDAAFKAPNFVKMAKDSGKNYIDL